MIRVKTKPLMVGPADAGRVMALDDFDLAEGAEGFRYELSRGRVVVTNVPDPDHFDLIMGVRRQFNAYDLANPGTIYGIAAGSECKLLLPEFESERHPDIAIYKTPPPRKEVWRRWIPEIVIEIVSRGSVHRDYVEKREEYLAFGVKEYWIIDANLRQMLVLRRSGNRWLERKLDERGSYRTRLLPGFSFSIGKVFG